MRLEAPELDQLIHALAEGRAQLLDEVAPGLDEGARITNTVVNPTHPLLGRNTRKGQILARASPPGAGLAWISVAA